MALKIIHLHRFLSFRVLSFRFFLFLTKEIALLTVLCGVCEWGPHSHMFNWSQKNLQEKLLFNCVFHHDGEFVRDDVLFYRGGKHTIVSNIDLQTWGMAAIDEIVTGWGYDKQYYRVWGAVDGKDGQFFQIYVDHLAEEVAIRAIGDEVDGHIYLEHNQHEVLVRDLEFREPICFDMKFNVDLEDSGYSSDDLGLDDRK